VILARDTMKERADLTGKTWAISQMGAISQTYAKKWLDHYGIEMSNGSDRWHFGRARALLPAGGGHMITFGSGCNRNERESSWWNTCPMWCPAAPVAGFASRRSREAVVLRCYVYGVMTPFATPTPEALSLVEEPKIRRRRGSTEQVRRAGEVYLGQRATCRLDPNGGLYPSSSSTT